MTATPLTRAALAVLALVLAGSTLAQGVAGAWTEGAPMPTARSEMPAAALDGIIYVPGGLGTMRTLGTFEAFDPGTGSWRALPELPEPVHHSGVAAADGRVFVSGGFTSLDFGSPHDGFWAFDPAEGAWSRLPDLPDPRASHTLVALDGVLYVVGGVGPDPQRTWRFDPVAERWIEPAAPLLTAREHLAAAVLEGRIYAVGGRWEGRGNVAAAEVYDPATDAWTPLPRLPTPRSGLSAGAVAGRLHVVGGEALGGGATFEQHEVFDPGSGRWAAAPPLTPARHGLASAVVGSRWYVIGGATGAGGATFTTLTDFVSVWEGD